jgi:hypothetical protein
LKCPHCFVEFHDEERIVPLGDDIDGGWCIQSFTCPNPECKKFVLFLINGRFGRAADYSYFITQSDIKARFLIRPKGSQRLPAAKEVPIELAQDFNEACLVISDSPKASAALSRRCLQSLLREYAGVTKSDLANEIKELLESKNLPSHISESIDAVRNIGNFATHPLKSKSTGEIVPVEPMEADWNLDVLEMLFDFYFIKPAETLKRKKELNKKLTDLGKPEML